MEYWLVIDADSPYGQYLLAMQGKIGGATTTMDTGLKKHPAIRCSGLDWGTAPALLSATHFRNPDVADRLPQQVIVPRTCIACVLAIDPIAAGGASAPAGGLVH